MPGRMLPAQYEFSSGTDAATGDSTATLTPVEIATAWANAYRADGGEDSPEKTTILMTAIALAESGGKASATNPSSATGLWQVETSSHPQYTQSELEDPTGNAAAAVSIYKGQGLGAWSTYTGGQYKRYLATAAKAVKDPNFLVTGLNDFSDAAEDVAKPVEDAVSDTLSVSKFLAKFADLLFTQKGWVRIFKFMVGVFIGGLAIKEIFKDTPVGDAVKSVSDKLPALALA